MDVTLTVESGRPTGSRSARRLRAAGKVPAVIYGMGADPVPVAVDWPELRRAISTDAGLNALIDLELEGEHNLSIVKDLQRDPVRRTVEHVDFLLIDRNAKLSVDVPILLTGTAKAVEAEKGIVDQVLYALTVSALPGRIPTQIEADISHLELGTTLTVGELVLPEGVEPDIDVDEPVAVGAATRSTLQADEELAEGEEGAEGAEGAEGEGGGESGEAGGDAGDED